MSKIGVMIIDDSAVVRRVLSQQLQSDPTISVIATAADPIFAQKHLEKAWPDVFVLDLEMPRMDGISFLKKIMLERPTPVVICSTLTGPSAETTMLALESGAVDIINKPKIELKDFLNEEKEMILNTVKAAAAVNRKNLLAKNYPLKEKKVHPGPAMPEATKLKQTTDKIIAIGTSTGGTQALEAIVTKLHPATPGIVVVQHMPEKFTLAFANRLDKISELKVIEAQDGDRVLSGQVLIAPGGKHMSVRSSGARYVVAVQDGPVVNRHRPSVDVLFRSVAATAGKNALGIILTGMGNDGAAGLRDMRLHGALTLAQDEASSIIFGMPKEAIKMGAAGEIHSLDGITQYIQRYAEKYRQ